MKCALRIQPGLTAEAGHVMEWSLGWGSRCYTLGRNPKGLGLHLSGVLTMPCEAA